MNISHCLEMIKLPGPSKRVRIKELIAVQTVKKSFVFYGATVQKDVQLATIQCQLDWAHTSNTTPKRLNLVADL